MSIARRFLDRVNSPGVERIVRYNGPNGKFIDFVDVGTRESVAFRLEFPDGTVKTYRRPRHVGPPSGRHTPGPEK